MMTTPAWLFLLAAEGLAGIGWLASWRRWRLVVVVARPGAMVCLAGVVLWLLDVDPDVQVLFVIGVISSGVGDLLLALPRHYFASGAAWFLVGRVLYGLGFLRTGVDGGVALLVLIVAGFSLLTVGRILLGQIRRLRPGLFIGTSLYMVVAATTVALAVATGNATAGCGAVALALADLLLGWNRFVRALAGGHGSIHVFAQTAQVVVVMSLLSG